MNLQKMQQSQPPAYKRQWLLCTSAANAASTEEPVGIACNESIAVACEESVHSVAEQNQRLPKAKPFCRGYLPDVPPPFVQNWAFAADKVDLVNGAEKNHSAGGVQLSICLYRAVKKGSVANPCTNRPVPCQICLSTTGAVRHYVWSYHYLDHMQSIHPGPKLTEEEAAKYAIHKEKYLGVLGKE